MPYKKAVKKLMLDANLVDAVVPFGNRMQLAGFERYQNGGKPLEAPATVLNKLLSDLVIGADNLVGPEESPGGLLRETLARATIRMTLSRQTDCLAAVIAKDDSLYSALAFFDGGQVEVALGQPYFGMTLQLLEMGFELTRATSGRLFRIEAKSLVEAASLITQLREMCRLHRAAAA